MPVAFPCAVESSSAARPIPDPAPYRVGELTDAEWAAISPLLPPARRTGRRRSTDLRSVVSAINHHWRTGRPWRKLPPGFPPWPTVYTYFRNWLKDGTLRKIRAILNPPRPSEIRPSSRRAAPPPVRLHPGRDPSPPRPSASPLNPR